MRREGFAILIRTRGPLGFSVRSRLIDLTDARKFFVRRVSVDDGPPLFNFIRALSTSTQAISARHCGTLQDYAAKFMKPVYRDLGMALRGGKISLPDIRSISPGEPGCTIVAIGVDGYHNNRPSRVTIRLSHEDQVLLPLEIVTNPLTPGLPITHGISEIGNRLIEDDPMLSHYWRLVEPDFPPSDDMLRALQFSFAFIGACGGAEAKLINPSLSESIGGDTHIATISPSNGFRWIPDLKPNFATNRI